MQSKGKAVDPANPDTIPKYVEEMPVPPMAKPRGKVDGKPYYEIAMRQVPHRYHPHFPPTTIWGYEGHQPGPTFHVEKDETILVKWENKLPPKHLLPVDRTLHESAGPPDVRTVVHLHGANVNWESDGYPEAWFSRDFGQTGDFFTRKVYEYTNRQPGATLWYHDHAIGITRLNVYAGLTGFYLIHDPIEKKLNLPKGRYDIPMMIQDRTFNSDGSLFYPENSDPPAPVNPSVQPFFIGNTIAVNGKLWPKLTVEPRKYRFRVLNASNTNAYTLRLGDGRSFWQIATDGGLLEAPVELTELPLEPAERSDIIIDFSKHKGKKMILQNTNDEGNTGVIMRFDVLKPLSGRDESVIPRKLAPAGPLLKEEDADVNRLLKLDAIQDVYGRPVLLLDDKMWHDPVTEKPLIGDKEVWKFINVTNFPHPIHIHLIQFKILHRRPFDLGKFQEDGYIQYTGPPVEPEIYERGWKDTVKAEPGMVTSVMMEFTENPGQYVWHCHILEHEDYDMMRPMDVREREE